MKLSLGSRTVYVPSGTSFIVKVPSASVVALATTLPSFTASTLMPGSPDSPALGVFCCPPPPRVKSNQTVPVSCPGFAAGGCAAGSASFGRYSCLTFSSGTSALCPAW